MFSVYFGLWVSYYLVSSNVSCHWLSDHISAALTEVLRLWRWSLWTVVIMAGDLVGLLHRGTTDVRVFGFCYCFSSLGLLSFFRLSSLLSNIIYLAASQSGKEGGSQESSM